MNKMYLNLAAQASQPAKKDGRSKLSFFKIVPVGHIWIWKFDLDLEV